MSAFFLFDNLKVRNEAGLSSYVENVGPTVEKFGGSYRVLGGGCQLLEGEWTPTYPVIIEFESKDRALEWYNSEEYHSLKQLRIDSVDCNCVLIEGIRPQQATAGF